MSQRSDRTPPHRLRRERIPLASTLRLVPELVLNTIALDPNRWTPEKVAHFDLVDLLPVIAEAGFDALEVWQYHLARLTDEQVAALSERARSLGIALPVVGLYPALHLSGEDREREWKAMETLIARSAVLGAEMVKMFAGCLGSDEITKETFARSVAFAQEMAKAAAGYGLVLTAETHPDTLCDGVPATRRFLDAVAAPNVRVCFQPFDFASTEQTLADYRVLREHIVHVHVQGRRADRVVLLEEADLDYRAFLQVLAADGFDGVLCIEFVKGGIVERSEDFDLNLVLANARRDRAFVEASGLV